MTTPRGAACEPRPLDDHDDAFDVLWANGAASARPLFDGAADDDPLRLESARKPGKRDREEAAARIGSLPDGRRESDGEDGGMAGYKPRPGAVVEIHGHHVGERARTGEVLEILGEAGHEHFRVRWEDGRESIFYPSNDAVVRPARPGARRKS